MTVEAKMFSSFNLKGLELKNRVLKAATHDGGGFAELKKTYIRLARNDVALITVAYVAVSKTNKTFDNQHHIAEDNMAEWASLTEAVRRAGSKMSAQLHHPGLFCMSSTGTPMGPSFFYLPVKLAWPKTLTLEDIRCVKNEFVNAAIRCKEVGFECIELHCGHGYLLSQFLTPLINRRSDAYGGSAERRAQLPVEILREIRSAVGEAFPIVVKLNAEDFLPVPGGLHIEDSLVAARLLAEAGADAIIPSCAYTSLSGMSMMRGGVPYQNMADGLPNVAARWVMRNMGSILVPKVEYESLFLQEYNRRYVDLFRDTKCQVIYIGGADSFRTIEEVLSEGNCAVQLGRPLLREPYFVKKIAKELRGASSFDFDVSSRCIRCNMCTLASIDPHRFKAGCIFLKPTDGTDIEDVGDISARL